MPMQPDDLLTRLELAAAYLQQVRQQLVQCESSSAAQAQATLVQVAALLENSKASNWTEFEKQAGRKLLTDMRAGAARAQLLLDSAISFHCGAALAGPAEPESYAPDGSWQTSYPNDQICLNA